MNEYTIGRQAYKTIKNLDGIDSTFIKNVHESYSKIISPISLCNPCDVGFGGSQKPYEFFNAWKLIQEKLTDIESPTMLEIGAFKGLWAIAFFEWCILNNKKGEYYTVTWLQLNTENMDLLKVKNYYSDKGFKFTLFDMSSQLESTKEEVIKDCPNFSFVFIDADHRYDGAKKDIELYSKLATRVLGFHDIGPKEKCNDIGVYQAITDSNVILDKEFRCDENHMGIGLKLIN